MSVYTPQMSDIKNVVVKGLARIVAQSLDASVKLLDVDVDARTYKISIDGVPVPLSLAIDPTVDAADITDELAVVAPNSLSEYIIRKPTDKNRIKAL